MTSCGTCRSRLADADGGFARTAWDLILVVRHSGLCDPGWLAQRGLHMAAGASAIALVLGFSVVILMAYNFPYRQVVSPSIRRPSRAAS